LTPTDLDALKGILESDYQPWKTFTMVAGGDAYKENLLEVHISGSSKDEVQDKAEKLAGELKALGITAEVQKPRILFQEAVTATSVVTFVAIVIATLKGVKYLNDAIVAGKELPDNIKALLDRYSGGSWNADLHESLAWQAVVEWLNTQYGFDTWEYDPDQAELMPIAEVTLVDLVEVRTGNRHLLAVKDGEAHELPATWRSATSADGLP